MWAEKWGLGENPGHAIYCSLSHDNDLRYAQSLTVSKSEQHHQKVHFVLYHVRWRLQKFGCILVLQLSLSREISKHDKRSKNLQHVDNFETLSLILNTEYAKQLLSHFMMLVRFQLEMLLCECYELGFT